jgi:hypothetical protein
VAGLLGARGNRRSRSGSAGFRQRSRLRAARRHRGSSRRAGRGCRTSRRPRRPSAWPAPWCRRTRAARRSGRRTGRRPARRSCANRPRQSAGGPPSACPAPPRRGCSGGRRIRSRLSRAFVANLRDALEEVGHVRSLMAVCAARKRAWPASKAAVRAGSGSMVRAILGQGGDLGPRAGGGHQGQPGGPEGAAEIARDGQVDRARSARWRSGAASSPTATRRRPRAGGPAGCRWRPARRGSRGWQRSRPPARRGWRPAVGGMFQAGEGAAHGGAVQRRALAAKIGQEQRLAGGLQRARSPVSVAASVPTSRHTSSAHRSRPGSRPSGARCRAGRGKRCGRRSPGRAGSRHSRRTARPRCRGDESLARPHHADADARGRVVAAAARHDDRLAHAPARRQRPRRWPETAEPSTRRGMLRAVQPGGASRSSDQSRAPVSSQLVPAASDISATCSPVSQRRR